MIYRSPKEPTVSIAFLFIACAAAFTGGFFLGRIFFAKKNVSVENRDTIQSMLIRITILEDSLDNALWHLNDLKNKSILPDTSE
ncbi:hypothetical protein JW890_08680 [candidate division WOR-3 bacterium]|nr:hypothetical protein [candidate division WOR-3 bacterium]